MKARAAAPKFLEDSNYETELDDVPTKRRRIKPQRLQSESSDDDVPVKKSKKDIPPPPPVPVKLQKTSKAPKKGQGPTKEEVKRQERAELMKRLAAVRAAAASKMKKQSSPWKVQIVNEETSVSSTAIDPVIIYLFLDFLSDKLLTLNFSLLAPLASHLFRAVPLL